MGAVCHKDRKDVQAWEGNMLHSRVRAIDRQRGQLRPCVRHIDEEIVSKGVFEWHYVGEVSEVLEIEEGANMMFYDEVIFPWYTPW